jgi:hypothetical protein
MKRILMLTVWLLPLMVMGQEWTVVQEIKEKCLQVRIDQLGSAYGIRNGEIVKWDKGGQEWTRYSNKLIGSDLQLDVTNPMKVLLFSPDQMRLIFLDSRLGELREEVNLFREGYEQVSLAATSHSNGFWLYDPINFQLIRYDQYFKKERTSLNLAQILRLEFFPTALIEVDNTVYLSDPAHGIYVFDVFGNYIKRIPIKGVEQMMVADKRIFFRQEGQLKALQLLSLDIEQVDVDLLPQDAIDVSKNRMVIARNGAVLILKPEE